MTQRGKKAGRIVRQARESGIELPIFGFTRMANDIFLQEAGSAAEGVVVVATMNPDRGDPLWDDFQIRYRQRWGEAADSFAAHAYDGMTLLIEAVRAAGLNRGTTKSLLMSSQTSSTGMPISTSSGLTSTRFEIMRMPPEPSSAITATRNGSVCPAAIGRWTIV